MEEPDGRDARRRDLALPAAVSDALRQVARRRRLTLNTLVQGGVGSSPLPGERPGGRGLRRHGCGPSGGPAGVEGIAGPFLNTLPVRVEVTSELRLQGWLAAARGLRPEERVAVLAERSPDLIAALLGILQAGGAYLPLDPALPSTSW